MDSKNSSAGAPFGISMRERRVGLPCGAVAADCAFCAIVAGDSAAEVVHRDDVAVAFLDRTPLFPGHVLVVPVRHVATLPELNDVGPFFERVQLLAKAVPAAFGAQGTFVAQNNVVSQSVPHLHVHVVPRTRGDGLRGFFWPRTRYQPGQAEAVADRLRATLAELRDGR
jgi:histidine triad (HIT) family protein